MEQISSIRDLAAKYDVFIFDQYGVLHNGSAPYAGAVDLVAHLKSIGKTIAILSNSSKRAAFARKRLLEWQFGEVDAVITGGEATWKGLSEAWTDFQYGKRFVLFGWDDQAQFRIPDFELSTLDNAEFILLQGIHYMLEAGDVKTECKQFPDSFLPLLKKAHEKKLPMVCCNPDMVAVKPDGSLSTCPGSLAAVYEEMGGTVHYIGKPHGLVFDLVLQETGCVADSGKRAIMIGDSLHHDIKGADNTGIDSVFITGGVHAQELGIPAGVSHSVDREKVEALCQKHLGSVRPTYYSFSCI